MTVRVNKDSFNLREKLSELERPIGLKGSELMRSETAQEARDFISAGRKNMIINGACMINQRFDSGTYTLTASPDYFPVDRFRSWAFGGGQFTIQRSDNAPPGFKNSMMYTVSTADASIGSNDYYVVQQRIEGYNFAHLGWGTANAKPVTLSFWVKGDIPGKYGISFWPDGQNYNYVTSYTINNADTWEYKTITIPGATGGTWLTNNSTGFGIWWDFGTGTTYRTSTTETWGQNAKFAPSDSLQMIKTNSAKFRMTGVQLEVGKNATDFEHRSYGEELALCQRYYERFSADCGNGGYATLMMASKNSNTLIVGQPIFRVPKRASGATFSYGGLLRMHNSLTGSDITISSVQNYQLSTHGGYLVIIMSNNTMSNGDGFRLEGRGDVNAFIAFSSEL